VIALLETKKRKLDTDFESFDLSNDWTPKTQTLISRKTRQTAMQQMAAQEVLNGKREKRRRVDKVPQLNGPLKDHEIMDDLSLIRKVKLSSRVYSLGGISIS
jgi:hypothetical protein